MAKLQRLCSVVGCDSPATDKHHIGGHSSPMIWVCNNCHGRIHGISWLSDHSHLTKQGIVRAKALGRIGGNPGLRAGDPEAIRKIRATMVAREKERLIAESEVWLPKLVAMRPLYSWDATAVALGITKERLRRIVKKLVAWELVDARVLDRSERATPESRKLLPIIRALAPVHSLNEIARRLEEMRLRTPRGGARWHASSVRYLLLKAGLPPIP